MPIPRIETRPYFHAPSIAGGDLQMISSWLEKSKGEMPAGPFWTSENAVVAFDPETKTDIAAGFLFPHEVDCVLRGICSNPACSMEVRADGMRAVIAALTTIATMPCHDLNRPLDADCPSMIDANILRTIPPSTTR